MMETSVSCNIRPCCFECQHADMIVKNTRIGKTKRQQTITCSHENVCRLIYANLSKPTVDDLVLPYIEEV